MSLTRDNEVFSQVKAIASALVGNYIEVSNETDWKLSSLNPTKLPPLDKYRHKIELCSKLLQKIDQAKIVSDLEKISIWCYEIAQSEISEAALRRQGVLLTTIVRRFLIREVPILSQMLQAVNSYLNSQMKNEASFEINKAILQQRFNELNADGIDHIALANPDPAIKNAELAKKNALEKSRMELNALNNSVALYNGYFKTFILKRDKRALQLKENDFEDFSANIVSGKRSSDRCKELLSYALPANVRMTSAIEMAEIPPAPAPLPVTPLTDTKVQSKEEKVAPDVMQTSDDTLQEAEKLGPTVAVLDVRIVDTSGIPDVKKSEPIPRAESPLPSVPLTPEVAVVPPPTSTPVPEKTYAKAAAFIQPVNPTNFSLASADASRTFNQAVIAPQSAPSVAPVSLFHRRRKRVPTNPQVVTEKRHYSLRRRNVDTDG